MLEVNECKVTEKPPLGVEPRWSHSANRLNELVAAIIRYIEAGLEVPIEWIEEYNDLNSKYGHYTRELFDDHWLKDKPNEAGLYDVTIKRLSDNNTWVQNLIYRNHDNVWIWAEGEENEVISDNFKVLAWKHLAKQYNG